MSDAPVKVGMTPPHVGDFIRDEIIEGFDLNVSKAADILGVRRATLSDVVNHHASLSADMAMRIEKAFGVDMELLLRMQLWHDTIETRRQAKKIDVKRYEPA
jgi:antitoxin HigA-1